MAQRNSTLVLKKSLGQHFLHDKNIMQKIDAYVQRQLPVRLLEIGAGGGALTDYLIKIPDIHLKAVEIDADKIALLNKKFSDKKIDILQADILSLSCPFDKPFWVVGNLPYYISSSILFKMLEWKESVIGVVCMLQKEVAERICSTCGSKRYGILSVLLQSFFEVEYLFDVPPDCFTPPPKVMSGVIALKAKTNPFLGNEKKLKHLVKTAFNQRRKMLRNSASILFDKVILSDPLFSKRPEQLPIEIFHQLINQMK